MNVVSFASPGPNVAPPGPYEPARTSEPSPSDAAAVGTIAGRPRAQASVPSGSYRATNPVETPAPAASVVSFASPAPNVALPSPNREI